MGTTLAFTFPMGRYHATSWDGGANTSEVEWPPSPWRILRALVATWHNRWPDLPAADVERVLAALGAPDAYRLPPTRPGSTRHYMPDLNHTRGETGNTDMVIDSFLGLSTTEPLLVYWSADLPSQDQAVLRELAERMPYLGRSESVCRANLSDRQHVPDDTWWRVSEAPVGGRQTELLAPAGRPRLVDLEVTTTATRGAGRRIPAGSRRLTYATHASAARPTPIQSAPTIDCLRFALSSEVPVRARNGVLVADALQAGIKRRVAKIGPDGSATALIGWDSAGAPSRAGHGHAHFLALPASSGVGAQIPADMPLSFVYIWTSNGIPDGLVGSIQTCIRSIRPPVHLDGAMARQMLSTAGAGAVAELLPGLAGSATEWVSATPYLPVRHRKKRQSDVAFTTADIGVECGYRGIAPPASVELLDSPEHRREIVQFRRRRAAEPLRAQRRGVYLRLRFEQAIRGPLLLGQLSHFGCGLFVPAESPRLAG